MSHPVTLYTKWSGISFQNLIALSPDAVRASKNQN